MRTFSTTVRRGVAVLATVLAGSLAGVSAAQAADVGFVPGSLVSEAQNADGTPYTVAGGTPFQVVNAFKLERDETGGQPEGLLRGLDVGLPVGLTGNPQALTACSRADFNSQMMFGPKLCAPGSQVGQMELVIRNLSFDWDQRPMHVTVPVYNVATRKGEVAHFAFRVMTTAIHLSARVRPGDFGVSTSFENLATTLPLMDQKLTLWGDPSSAAHDADRGFECLAIDGEELMCGGGGIPSGTSPAAFWRMPTRCDDVQRTTFRATGWNSTAVVDEQVSAPASVDCDQLPFSPTLDVTPDTTQAGAPVGLRVDLGVPQSQDPNGRATAHLKDAAVTLPAGMTVSASGADGLGACTDEQFAIDSNAESTCPTNAKIGTATLDTPVLEGQVPGTIYLGTQQPDQLLRVFLAFYDEQRDLSIKLPGRLVPDPVTGQITAHFDANPELPFTNLSLRFKGGPRAPLSNPTTCGAATTTSTLTSWAGQSATPGDQFAVTGCGDPNRFEPTVDAGTLNPLAGAFSPFTVTVARTDADQELKQFGLQLPQGLLGALSSAPVGSQVGRVAVTAGAGSSPYQLDGRVYLEGPYKGAPFSLKIVVPAKAGPLDLGEVVVRSPLQVDAARAQISAPADPLPTILQGIPLKIRSVNLTLDRPGFTFNATNCAPQQVGATLASTAGTNVGRSVRYQAAGCGDLPLSPRMSLDFRGKGELTKGRHPGLVAQLSQAPGQAGLKRVEVKLPSAVALAASNAQALCTPQQAADRACPAASIVGNATVRTPALREPLAGPVYFVEGTRQSASGQTIKTLPKLWLKLEGEGVPLDLWGTSQVDSSGPVQRLVTTFEDVPDAPIGDFRLEIAGGKHGILAATQSICTADRKTQTRFDGQNGARRTGAVTVGAVDCGLRVAKATTTRTAVRVTVSGIGAGRVRVTGKGIVGTSRTIARATSASVTARLSAAARRSVAQGRSVRVPVRVAYTAQGQKKAKTATRTVTVKGTRR